MAAKKRVPDELLKWLEKHDASVKTSEYAPVARQDAALTEPTLNQYKAYVLTTVRLKGLQFGSHKYNPRTPNIGKVNELKASIRQLTMLSPLTCAYIEENKRSEEEEEVVLIDGRHRFSALEQLKDVDPNWFEELRIDLKVFYGLEKSDLYVLATYLNRLRRPLKRGEYYRAIVNMYDEKQLELEGIRGAPVTEDEVFNMVHARDLADRDFDLSVGRLVGLTAFNEEEEGAWYPFVGDHQNAKYKKDGNWYYCPLTAGNLAEFLRYLCMPRPYRDYGQKRAVERINVLTLGKCFRDSVIKDELPNRGEPNGTSVASKFWCMSALGKLTSALNGIPETTREASVMSREEIDWNLLRHFLDSYAGIMARQAEIVKEYLASEEMLDLSKAWSYQTQRDQVKDPLQREFESKGFGFRD